MYSSVPGALSTLVTSVVSCSLLVDTSYTDESWEGRNTSLWIYFIYIYIYCYLLYTILIHSTTMKIRLCCFFMLSLLP